MATSLKHVRAWVTAAPTEQERKSRSTLQQRASVFGILFTNLLTDSVSAGLKKTATVMRAQASEKLKQLSKADVDKLTKEANATRLQVKELIAEWRASMGKMVRNPKSTAPLMPGWTKVPASDTHRAYFANLELGVATAARPIALKPDGTLPAGFIPVAGKRKAAAAAAAPVKAKKAKLVSLTAPIPSKKETPESEEEEEYEDDEEEDEDEEDEAAAEEESDHGDEL